METEIAYSLPAIGVQIKCALIGLGAGGALVALMLVYQFAKKALKAGDYHYD